MNLLLLRSDDAWLDERSVQLEDQRAQHIRTVLKASVGDALRAGVVGGNLGQAVITAVDDHGVTLTVDCQDPPPPATALTSCWPCRAPRCCGACCAPWRNSGWRICI